MGSSHSTRSSPSSDEDSESASGTPCPPGSFPLIEPNDDVLPPKSASNKIENITEPKATGDHLPTLLELSRLLDDGVGVFSQVHGHTGDATVDPLTAERKLDAALSSIALWMIQNSEVSWNVDYILRAAAARRDEILVKDPFDPGRASTRFFWLSRGFAPSTDLVGPTHDQSPLPYQYSRDFGTVSPLSLSLTDITLNFAQDSTQSQEPHWESTSVNDESWDTPSAPVGSRGHIIPLPSDTSPEPSEVSEDGGIHLIPVVTPAVHAVEHDEGYRHFDRENIDNWNEWPQAMENLNDNLPPRLSLDSDLGGISSPLETTGVSSGGPVFSSPASLHPLGSISYTDIDKSLSEEGGRKSPLWTASARLWDDHFWGMREWKLSRLPDTPPIAPPNTPRIRRLQETQLRTV